MDKETYIKHLEILELDSLPQDFPTLAQVKSAYHRLKELYSFAEISVVTEPLEDEFSTNDRMEIIDQLDIAYEALVHFLVDKDRVEKEAFARAGIMEDTKAEYFPPEEDESEEEHAVTSDLHDDGMSTAQLEPGEITGELDLPEVEDLQADEHELSVSLAQEEHHIEMPADLHNTDEYHLPPEEPVTPAEPETPEEPEAIEVPELKEEPETIEETEIPEEPEIRLEPERQEEPLLQAEEEIADETEAEPEPEPEPEPETEPEEEPDQEIEHGATERLEAPEEIEIPEEPAILEESEILEEPEILEDDLPEPDEMEIEEISHEIERAKTDPEGILQEVKDEEDTTPRDPYVDTVPFPDAELDGATIPLPPDMMWGPGFKAPVEEKAATGTISAGPEELLEGRSIKGRTLKKVREKLGLGIHEVAVSTKISYKILVNIEKERFSKLPEPGYLRWCISKYAKELTLDQKIVTDEYMRRFRQWQRTQESK